MSSSDPGRRSTSSCQEGTEEREELERHFDDAWKVVDGVDAVFGGRSHFVDEFDRQVVDDFSRVDGHGTQAGLSQPRPDELHSGNDPLKRFGCKIYPIVQ